MPNYMCTLVSVVKCNKFLNLKNTSSCCVYLGLLEPFVWILIMSKKKNPFLKRGSEKKKHPLLSVNHSLSLLGKPEGPGASWIYSEIVS